jgi:hypothetical protein
MLVWLVPPLILSAILAILYGPGLVSLWNKMPDDQFSQLQSIEEELRLSHPHVKPFQEPSRNHVTFQFFDVTDKDDQDELVTWFREAKAQHKVTFEMTLEFYEQGQAGETTHPSGGNTQNPGPERKLLRRVEV